MSIKRIALVLIVVCATADAASAAAPGQSGALFLRLGMGARAAGMGEAFIGVAEDASAVYWNPGAMSAVLGTHVTLHHNEYVEGVALEQLAITHEIEYGTLGFSFTGMHMDKMERRANVPTFEPDGEFGALDASFALAFSRYILPNTSVGVSVKSIYEKIDEVTAEGFAFDAGVYHVARIKGVRFAAVAGNIGSPMKFQEQTFALPRYIKAGGSYERKLPSLHGDMLVTLDIMFPNDGDAREHIGFEYGYDDRVFLRAGYKAGYDSQGAAFGLGAHHDRMDMSYAFVLMRNDLGDGHRFGISLSY